MNKREADTILLACKKHRISLTMRKEGDVYLVEFMNRIDIKSFEEAKLISNGLVIEGRHKKQVKRHIVELGTNTKLNFSKYPTRKNRPESSASWAARHGGIEDLESSS